MFDNASYNEIQQKESKIRYSQNSLNSTQNSDLDYNLYCYSQGYQNKEKGFWRGVLRNKNIDFALRFNKEWNKRIELEDELSVSETQSQMSSLETDVISFVNESDIGWDKNLFENFKKKQTGIKKQKNKEWLFSNGVKRAKPAIELRTQNYKQFEENEINKKLKKEKEKEKETSYQNKPELILQSDKYNINRQRNENNIYPKAEYGNIKTQPGEKINMTQYKYDAYQRSPRGKASDKKEIIYGNYSDKINYNKTRSEISYGQNYGISRQKGDESYIKSFVVQDRPNNLERLEVSAERKTKEKKEVKIEPRRNIRLYSNEKKRLVSLDKDGKPLTNTARINVSIEKKKEPRARLNNIARFERSEEKKQKKSIGRKVQPRINERIPSVKKRKITLDKDGKPLPNTSRKNIDTSTKKKPRERLENRARLEISAERKEKKIIRREVSPRKNVRIKSVKKKKLSLDKDGKPLPNTKRINVDTSSKKKPRERLENRARLEISAERKEKKIIRREVSPRKNVRIKSVKKKKLSLDKDGKPLPNTKRINIDTSSKKKAPKERLKNTSRKEVSVKSKSKEKIGRKISPRKNYRIQSPRKRKTSVDSEGNPISNVNRLNVNIENGEVKYARLEDFDKYEDKTNPRYKVFTQTSSKYEYKKPITENSSINTPIKKQEYNKKDIINQSQNILPGQTTIKTSTEAGKAFFANRYQRIKKGDIITRESFTDYKTFKNNEAQKTQQKISNQYSYTNLGLNSSKLNTNDTNISYKIKQQTQGQYQKPIEKIDNKNLYEYIPETQKNKYTASNNLNKNDRTSTKRNSRYQETQVTEQAKNRSSVSYNKYGSSSNGMAYFKLQFLTTKQVVEKFWESIDNGELSISMFDPQKNSSKLSNYLSPEKSGYSKLNNKIQNTDIKMKGNK